MCTSYQTKPELIESKNPDIKLSDVLKKLLMLLPQGDRLKLTGLFLMMLLASFLEVIGIGFIPIFVSIIAQPDWVFELEAFQGLFTALDLTTAGDLLVYGSISLIVFFLVKGAYLVFYYYVEARFVYKRYSLIGSRLFQRYMTASYEFKLRRNTSELLRNIVQETYLVILHVLSPFLRLAMGCVLITSITVFLLFREPVITLSVLALFGICVVGFIKFVKESVRQYGKNAQDDRARMIKSVNEGLGGYKEARVLNREAWFYSRFKDQINSYSGSLGYQYVISMSTKPVIELITISGILFIALALYWQDRGVETVIPVLALFGTALIRLLPAIKNATSELTNLRYYCHAVYPVFNDTVELNPEAANSPKQADDDNQSGTLEYETDIRFENVGYAYEKTNTQAVARLNLTIKKGEAVGFVGSSGAGKTTLVDILLGLLKPQEGRILVDGVDYQSNISAWQRNIGYIPQFIYLADDTVRNNIAFGLSDEQIDGEKIITALKTAQLYNFVESLPNGIHTVIGENGARLSGGQRQRIGIARALYHDPEVLIMDEATSALDNVTERQIVEAIEILKGERTVIMIAHRLSTVQNCDKLFLMKDGTIVESGSFDELLADSEDFRRMSQVPDP